MNKHIGKQTIRFENPPVITATASFVGPKEGEGPLRSYFDYIMPDALGGETSWEKAESKLVEDSIKKAVSKAGLKMEEIDYIFAGDLLNQSVGSTFGIRSSGRPFFGIFGACSTIGEGLGLASIMVDGGFASNVLASASSHYCAAEKQFRYPLELGTQRAPSAQWTVTGDGSVVVSSKGAGPKITYFTTGKIIDMGITDSLNMGAAMAPAAYDTLKQHLYDTGRTVDYYDIIATGDLGYVGRDLVIRLMEQDGVVMGKNYTDCGIEIFDKDKQDTHAGGSGCGCSAVTFAGYFFDKMIKGSINKLLLIPTGALMSPTSTQQGESIPGIAHAVAIENI